MTTVREELDFAAQGARAALWEAMNEIQSNEAIVYSTLDSLEAYKLYTYHMSYLHDPEGDYKDWASDSYAAIVETLDELGVTDFGCIPDGYSCPRSYSAWWSDHRPASWANY